MKNNFLLTITIILCFTSILYGQISEYGNLEIYSRETSFSTFGYFSGSFPLSGKIGGERIDMNGVNFSHFYEIANIGSIVATSDLDISILLKGAYKIGGAVGEKTINNTNEIYPTENIKYYMINLDLFTMSFQPEMTYIFDNGYALTVFLGLDFFNAGGNIAILEQDNISKEYIVSAINLIPLTFRPGIYLDFGRSAFGISGQINTTNIFEYRILDKDLYSGMNGSQSLDAFFRKFELQILYTF
jgi:hypothetical protein